MLISLIERKIQHAAHSAFPDKIGLNDPIELVVSTQEQFGHYQCNSAMKLTKMLGMKPREVAESIVARIDNQDSSFEKVEIAGPGFINITLSPNFLSQEINDLNRAPSLHRHSPTERKRTIVEFSSPNVAKELHVGHLRSTIIGDCLARLFEYLGYDVLRLNHIGDWGTAFGMLIAYLKQEHPHILTGKEQTDLSHLVDWYKQSKKRFDEDPEFKKTSQLEVVALQGGNKDSLRAWEIICEISRKAYQEIYDLLDIKLVERGESFYNPMLPDVVADLDKKGLITVSDGAKCVFMEGFSNREGDLLPLMVQKSDGGYNYDTTDMAAMKHRAETEKADRIIIVTDAGQSTHFKMIAKASELAGYLDPAKVQFDHVPFGLVLRPDGTKFKTREGETTRLIDLLTAAIDEAKKMIAARSPEMPETEQNSLAKALGISAIKYADLSGNRTSDYVFSYERMLRFEGNTAAYLLYSYVRINGIKRKVGCDIEKIRKEAKIDLKHPSEIGLALHLLRFDQALELIARDLLPNRLTDYLYQLAEKFNLFFRDCRVEGSPEEKSRLLLCDLTARVMKEGLHILGVETVEKM